MWWQVNSRMDALSTLLTDNLIVLNRDIGELKGASHSHNPCTNQGLLSTRPEALPYEVGGRYDPQSNLGRHSFTAWKENI